MPRIPAIPRLSIIVPLGDDVSAFEDTLVSVLENQPAGSEILVAHDSSYNDPFDLTDEVRFVTTTKGQQVDLVLAAIEHSRGRFVHVLSSGLKATCDWADVALEQFERQNAAVVAPIIRDTDGQIVAAGWGDHAGRLCQPIAAGTANVQRRDACRILGAYLQASFWRRDVLRSVASAFKTRSVVEASYAYGRMLMAADWICAPATGSQVVMQQPIDLSGPSSFSRGQRLWAIKKAIDPATRKVAWSRILTGMLEPSGLAETIGQVCGPRALPSMQSRLEQAKVPYHSDRGAVIPTPEQTHAA